MHGLRSLHFETDEEDEDQEQAEGLAEILASVVEDHCLIVGVSGLHEDCDIVTSAIVDNMQRATKSSFMVPHLLGRKGLPLSIRYEFLRRMSGSLSKN